MNRWLPVDSQRGYENEGNHWGQGCICQNCHHILRRPVIYGGKHDKLDMRHYVNWLSQTPGSN